MNYEGFMNRTRLGTCTSLLEESSTKQKTVRSLNTEQRVEIGCREINCFKISQFVLFIYFFCKSLSN